jgi:hypothetical protein
MITTCTLARQIHDSVYNRIPNEHPMVRENIAFYTLEQIEDTIGDIVDDVIKVRLEELKSKYANTPIPELEYED